MTAFATSNAYDLRRSPDPVSLLEQHPELRIERDDYNINVTSELGESISTAHALELLKNHRGAGQPAHLYFHIPLCAYICAFCNYVKRRLPGGEASKEAASAWTQLLITESERYLEVAPWYAEARIESVYFGGGTASVLGATNLGMLLDHIRTRYQLSANCEMTLEGNPDDLQAEFPRAAARLGINRFSVGVQALDDRVNKATGRGHDTEMSYRAIERLRELDRPFNVDMMFGLPYQTVDSVVRDITELAERLVPTITIYRLRNFDREKLGIGLRAAWNMPTIKARLEEQGAFPSLHDTYAMRRGAVAVLLQYGYQPSPLGWWSLPGTYGEHNIPRVSRNKWERYDSMLAFGPGAYAWLSGGNSALQLHHSIDIDGHRSTVEARQVPVARARVLRGQAAVATALGFNFKSGQPVRIQRYLDTYGVDIGRDEPYATVMGTLTEKSFVKFTQADNAYVPTLDGEVLHEEIISVYFHGMLGSADVSCKRSV